MVNHKWIALIFLVGIFSCQAQINPDVSKDANLKKARQEWIEAIDQFSKGPPSSVRVLDAKSEEAIKAVDAFPANKRIDVLSSLHDLYRRSAGACASKGFFADALRFLNQETQLQSEIDPAGVYSKNQDHYFFTGVLLLEAKILGHLQRGYYPEGIDHYFMPIGQAQPGKMDSFVAMSATDSDEVGGISIPPLPENQDRKCFYLISPDAEGNYAITKTIQFIGYRGKKTQISLSSGGDSSVLTIDGLTNTVEYMNPTTEIPADYIPNKYVPIHSQSVKLDVSPNGFRLLK